LYDGLINVVNGVEGLVDNLTPEKRKKNTTTTRRSSLVPMLEKEKTRALAQIARAQNMPAHVGPWLARKPEARKQEVSKGLEKQREAPKDPNQKKSDLHRLRDSLDDVRELFEDPDEVQTNQPTMSTRTNQAKSIAAIAAVCAKKDKVHTTRNVRALP
jgi:hypothetical protein